MSDLYSDGLKVNIQKFDHYYEHTYCRASTICLGIYSLWTNQQLLEV